MRIKFLILLLSATMLTAASKNDKLIDRKVADLLKKMSLEEKVGQMTQISLEVIAKGGDVWHPDDPLEIDMAKARRAIVDYKVGSILNVGTHAHPIEKWHQIITTIQDLAVKETPHQIPILYGIDAIHGATYVKGATLFPQSIAMAATWNVELMKKIGEITAYEVRAAGIPWNFNPVLDIGRQPLWPRLWETFGEDPYLASCLGAAYVKGLEGDDNDIAQPGRVAACMKHYLGYSLPLTGKDRTPAWIPERLLRDYVLPPFQAAISAGAHTVMANSSSINGMPVHASRYYLTELLRGELGFKGLVVSDWADIINLHTRERVAPTLKEAVRMAVMAGIDMSMVPHDFSFYELLLELTREKQVPMKRIDEAVARILKLKFQLGLFANPYPPHSQETTRFACREFTEINLQAAHEALTLLKNDPPVLPLRRGIKILLTGPNADRLSVLNGGWTITWQGNREDLYPQEKYTVREALQEKNGAENVRYVPGTTHDKEIDIAAAISEAVWADVIVACLGEEAYCESEGNIVDLTLPAAQIKLVQALQSTGKPVVLVLIEGRPRVINSIVDHSQAILMAYLPGMEGGRAIADVLLGDANPSGKLPITYPRHVNDFTLYDHTYAENRDAQAQYRPQWPFGYGLSYTTFSYSNLQVDKTKFHRGEEIIVSVNVTNTGDRAGQEVVQLYVSDLYASLAPAEKKLKAFAKIALQPKETKKVTFTLKPSDFAFTDLQGKQVVEAGEFRITVGSLSKNVTML